MTPWLAFLLPLFGGAALFAGPSDRRWLGGASVVICLSTLLVAILATKSGGTGTVDWGGPLRLQTALTPFSAIVAMLVPIVAAVVIAYASAHEKEAGLRRLIGLLVLFLAGMELLLVADDFLTLLIGWEAVGACSWALIAHDWQDGKAGHSAIYAFIATRLGDLGLFVAAIATYAGTGSFAFDRLPDLPPVLLALATAGAVLSAAAKSGQIPFSPWLFRAMAGPTSVSALLHAATMVAAGAYLMIRLQPLLAPVAWFGGALVAIGLVTALAGGGVALVQPHAKKLLAASTSAHYGLMFVATGAGFPVIALLHLVAHALFKSLLFLVAGIAGERAGGYELRHMGFAALMPITAVASAIGALALAGVPPLGAAWTKEQIVGAAGAHGAIVALLVMVAGMLSAAYAARFHLMAFGIVKRDVITNYLPSFVEKAAPVLLAIGSLLLGGLWLGSVHTPLIRRIGGTLPDSSGWEIVLSLGFAAAGLILGDTVARRTEIGTGGRTAVVANWLGLPRIIDALIVQPTVAICRLAARIDDRVIDAGARMSARLVRTAATRVSEIDDRVVDAGVRRAGWLGRRLAGLGAVAGEAWTDALPTFSAALISSGGRQAVRLQTGMAHHYYALIAGGMVGVVVLLLLGL
jgi:NADH-quinone oxidoreductase subunit L